MKKYKYIRADKIEEYPSWDIEEVFPASTNDMNDYVIISKTDVPIQNFIKLHEATNEQLLEELYKRVENK